MTTRGSNEHVEKCVRHQANHKVSYSSVIEIEVTSKIKGCTHEVWMKSMVKDSVVPKEIITTHY